MEYYGVESLRKCVGQETLGASGREGSGCAMRLRTRASGASASDWD
jgi:hypothetical protein